MRYPVFLALTGLAITSNSALAQAAKNLPPVAVTASPIAEPFAQSMRSTTTITRETIKNSSANNINDLLADHGGVDIHSRGAPGVQADVSIRGGNFEQTLVLIDGFPLANPQTAHHNLNIPIPLSHIKRIEIIKGPGAIQYGGSATSGVINILTRTPDHASTNIRAVYGSHNSEDLSAFLSETAGNSSHAFSARMFHVDSQESDKKTDADVHQGLYTGRAEFNNAEIKWGAAAESRDFGAWGFYSDTYPDAREKVNSAQAWGSADFDIGQWRAKTQLYWRNHKDWFITYIGNSGFENNNRTNTGGFKGSLARDGWAGTTVLGSNYKYEQITSDTYKYPNGDALDDHRDKRAFWLFRHQDFGDHLSAEASVNHVHYSQDTNYWLPSLALSWQFNDQWHSYASWARSARIPTYLDFYNNTPTNKGNLNLKSEHSDAYEIGLKGQPGHQTYELSLFERHTKNLIDWRRKPGNSYFEATNLDGYQSRGLDFDWRWQPHGRWLDSLGLGYQRLHADVKAPSDDVSYSVRFARQTFRADIQFKPTAHTRLGLNARRPEYSGQKHVTLLSAKLGWQGQHLNTFIEGRNLLNKEIVETGFYRAPKRWLYVGVGYDFN